MENNPEKHKKQLLEALKTTHGIVAPACESVGLNRKTFYEYYNNDNAFRAEMDAIRERTIDFVESKLIQNINNGDTTAQIFYLKCQAKRRGYIDKQVMVHSFNPAEEMNDVDLDARIAAEQNKITQIADGKKPQISNG